MYFVAITHNLLWYARMYMPTVISNDNLKNGDKCANIIDTVCT